MQKVIVNPILDSEIYFPIDPSLWRNINLELKTFAGILFTHKTAGGLY